MLQIIIHFIFIYLFKADCNHAKEKEASCSNDNNDISFTEDRLCLENADTKLVSSCLDIKLLLKHVAILHYCINFLNKIVCVN